MLLVPPDIGAGEGDVALFFFVEGSNHAAVHDEERTKYVVATAKSALSHHKSRNDTFAQRYKDNSTNGRGVGTRPRVGAGMVLETTTTWVVGWRCCG